MKTDKLITGLFLLVFGIILLLINIDVLRWKDIVSLWKLWPLIIIIFGIDIMLKDKKFLRNAIVLILVVTSILIWIIFRIISKSDLKNPIFNSSFMECKIEEDEIFFDVDLFGNVNIYPTDKKSIIVKTELPEKIENKMRLKKDKGKYYLKFPGIKNLKYFKKDSMRIEIGLPVKTRLNLKFSGGAIKGNFNFGDLMIRKLEVAFGAGVINLDFPVPNSILMEEFKIFSGASVLYIDKIGNANFEKCEISTGASSIEVDLGGKWRKNALLEISCAVTNVHLKFPKNTKFTIETEGILNPGLKEKLSKNPQFKVLFKGALNSINYTEYE